MHRRSGGGALGHQPRARGGQHRLDAGLERRVNNRGEIGCMVRRKFIDLAGLLGFILSVWSMPPTTQNTAGTFHAAANRPKSSLAVAGNLLSAGPRQTGVERRHHFACRRLVVAGHRKLAQPRERRRFGAPEAAASASMMRLIAASTRVRT